MTETSVPVIMPFYSERSAKQDAQTRGLARRYTVRVTYIAKIGAWAVQCRAPRATEPAYLRVDGSVR